MNEEEQEDMARQSFKVFFFFFFFEHRLSTPVGTLNLTFKHASQNTTYLPNPGVDFCVYGPFLSHHIGNHTPTSGSCREVLGKDRLKITGGSNKES